MLRRASLTLLPLTSRSIGSLRTFHNAISTIEKRSFGHEIRRRSFLPFSVATANKLNSDENLIRALETEMLRAEEPKDVGNIPNGFPFEIQDNPAECLITLKRKYKNETIKVEVSMPFNHSKDERREENKKKETNFMGVDLDVYYLRMCVKIFKENGQHLEFLINAYPNDLEIDKLLFKTREDPENPLTLEAPCFFDDAEVPRNLRKAFHRYLWNRGIKHSLTDFLLEYQFKKDEKEYLPWLKTLKNFVER